MSVKRNILIILFLAAPLVQLYSVNWLSQQSNVTSKLSKCIFTDSIHGWAAGDSGIILHTSNGGTSWVRQISGTVNFVFDMSFLNSSTGWCIASDINAYPSPVLLKTTNSGENWITIYSADTNYLLLSLYFENELKGWLAGYAGVMMNTTDGGQNWNIVPPDTSEFGGHTIWHISFRNSNFGYACGGLQDIAGVIWKSDNAGSNWRGQGLSSEPVYRIVFDDDLSGFGVGGDPEFGLLTVKTTNGGTNWIVTFPNFFGIGKSFSRRVYNEIWVPLSIAQAWAVTTNNGNSWIEIPTDNNVVLNDVFFADSLHGWAVGDNGVIQKYNRAVIGINGNQTQVISRYELDQNYPNPFNQSTVIEFLLPKFSKVRLTIYDAIGRELKVILDDFRGPGLNRVMFNPDGFSSGIYFYRLSAGNFNETKKLVIVK